MIKVKDVFCCTVCIIKVLHRTTETVENMPAVSESAEEEAAWSVSAWPHLQLNSASSEWREGRHRGQNVKSAYVEEMADRT